jgi:hypothetical protein
VFGRKEHRMIRGNILTIGFSTVELQISVPAKAQNVSKRLESERYRFISCRILSIP